MTRRKAYLLLQAAVCIALAVLLGASAVSIYREGVARKALDPLGPIYTPEIVAQKLALAAPLFVAFAVLLAAGLWLDGDDGQGDRPVREPRAARAQLDAERRAGVGPGPVKAVRRASRAGVRAALVVAAIVLIVIGALNGSARDVLYKAITICSECVGLG